MQGQAAAADLTINLTDVEAGQPDAPTVTRTEFSEPANPALDVSWTAPDANGLTINGYEVQYRRKAAEGEQAAAWTLYKYDDPANPGSQISLLAATATSASLPNLAAGATYEVQVRASTSEEGPGPWSDTGEGRGQSAAEFDNLAPHRLHRHLGPRGRRDYRQRLPGRRRRHAELLGLFQPPRRSQRSDGTGQTSTH